MISKGVGGRSALCHHSRPRLLLDCGSVIVSAFFLKVALSIVVPRLMLSCRWQMAVERVEDGFGSFRAQPGHVMHSIGSVT